MKFVLIKKRGIIRLVAVLLVFAAALCGVGLTSSAKVYSGRIDKNMPICSVDTDQKVVAISFDVCYGSENIAPIQSILLNQNASATFFVVGSWAQQNSELLQSLSLSPQVEIGSHANTHTSLKKAGKKADLEISTSAAIIADITQKQVELFRAPYGEYTEAVLASAQRCGLYPVYADVDTGDNLETSAMEIVNKALSSVRSGSIILMHTDNDNTVAALPVLIEGLKNKGYTLVSVGEMLYRDNYYIDNTGKQIRR